MNFFRNKEVRVFVGFVLIINSVFISIGFSAGIIEGIFTLIICAVFSAAFYFFTKKRYRNIAKLSEQIDIILHGSDSFKLNSFNEGELSILCSEIQKMTVRLRENADTLKKDKIYLSDSLADIAHQLRTPMTSLGILLSFLAKPEADEIKRGELAREAGELLARMDWLLSALLKISKIDAGTAVFHNEKVLTQNLIKKAVEPFSIPLELRGTELRINCNEDSCLTCDINWMAEAIGNILKNCMEHTGEGGIIEINCNENAIYTEINISDNGSGIAEKDLPHIFERFYQGEKTKTDSYGIGLALCRMILSEQKGTVKAINKTNGGAAFTIRLYK
jgi:signal transduction histidine kinase